MKVLFVSSGNAKDGISPIIRNQSQSLMECGLTVVCFAIRGKGFWSYFRHISILRKYLRINEFDIIHSHYSYSSFVASFAGAKNLVVSLMGSDVLSDKLSGFLISVFNKYYWAKTIVKSKEMYHRLNCSKVEIIPNGVNIDKINSLDKMFSQNILNWDINKRHVLFPADPKRHEKNYSLAKRSVGLLNLDREVVLHYLKDIPNENVHYYLNASDVLILCSHNEGSPNVIKEAMACNCPIVTTNVGDVKWVLGDTDGCYITSYDPEDIVEKLKLAIDFREKKHFTKGRERIIEIGLDSKLVANKIIGVYKDVLKIKK